MSTNALLTAEDMVAAALQELGVLAAGEEPSGDDVKDGIRALQWMLKSWQARGLNLWRQTTATVTIPAGSVSVDLSQSIADVVDARFGSPVSRPLFRYERAQYVSLPNKTSVGVPTIYYAERGVGNVTLFVWPVPVVDTELTLDAVRVINDVLLPDDMVDVPQEWTEAVYLGVAARIANTQGVTRADPNASTLIIQRAQALERQLFDMDRPSSYFMGPSLRGGYL